MPEAIISVKVVSSDARTTILIPNTRTPKDAFEQAEVDYSTAQAHLDGTALSAGQMNMSFADLGINEKAMLVAVVKTDNN